MNSNLNSKLEKITLTAVILNADGTVKEDLAVISATHANPIINAFYQLRIKFNELIRKHKNGRRI